MKTITSRKAYKTVLQLPEMWQSKSKVLYYSCKIEVLCCHRTFIFLLSLVLVTEPLVDFPRPSQLLVLPILFFTKAIRVLGNITSLELEYILRSHFFQHFREFKECKHYSSIFSGIFSEFFSPEKIKFETFLRKKNRQLNLEIKKNSNFTLTQLSHVEDHFLLY